LRVVAVVRDLILASRIEEAARGSGASYRRVDSPAQLPAHEEVDLVLVDWAEREPGWDALLSAWHASREQPRLVLFGPHTDLAAHADARSAGLGPMWARSRLVRDLPGLLAGRPEVSAERS
jgi:hypothetical protein